MFSLRTNTPWGYIFFSNIYPQGVSVNQFLHIPKFLDHRMPEIDGVETLLLMKERFPEKTEITDHS